MLKRARSRAIRRAPAAASQSDSAHSDKRSLFRKKLPYDKMSWPVTQQAGASVRPAPASRARPPIVEWTGQGSETLQGRNWNEMYGQEVASS